MCTFVGICTIASMGILKKHTDKKQNICYGCMYRYRVFSGFYITYFCHVPYVILTKYTM